MELFAPFTGTLFLPDKEFLRDGTPVLLPDGRSVAGIRWHTWTQRFEITDPAGTVVAECRAEGILRRRFRVTTPDLRPLLDLSPGMWRPFNGAQVTVGGTRPLTVRQLSIWSDRQFEFAQPDGPTIGRILPTTGTFTLRPDSYAFEIIRPYLSALEAIAVAQTLRLVARSQRAAASS
ncbi:hypothetical protein Q3W71_16295 [Micromonospora sp. C28SCA-DRY-2]|uniref:hypothetical protein n=1 Tax=Micromonospora sp. C28SCA-DRY-2 TaxID=3059522 RepID=UPI0026757AA1|nr:hypothetical protein [Micromonospora sp. C28SCA-DRY-2]MDO3703234.1 hypothetical protein [Micromonospora sp. C28SCA-DRY-2]